MLKTETVTATAIKVPDAAALARVRTLYLRVPSLSSPLYTRLMTLLAASRGSTPVSVFDASTKVYHKQAAGFLLNAAGYTALCRLLGTENVVPK